MLAQQDVGVQKYPNIHRNRSLSIPTRTLKATTPSKITIYQQLLSSGAEEWCIKIFIVVTSLLSLPLAAAIKLVVVAPASDLALPRT